MKFDSKWIFSKKKNKFVKIIQAGNLKLVDGLDIDKLKETLTIQSENFINEEQPNMKLMKEIIILYIQEKYLIILKI